MIRPLRKFRTITRNILASAIEYSVESKLDGDEMTHFFCTHYFDPLMEKARILSIRQRFIAYHNKQPFVKGCNLTREQKDFIYALAEGLRKGNLDNLNLEHPKNVGGIMKNNNLSPEKLKKILGASEVIPIGEVKFNPLELHNLPDRIRKAKKENENKDKD